jgi:hypothetical protein
MDSKKPLERAVDSLQRIYSLILALSIGQAISILVLDPATKQLIPLTADKIFSSDGVNFFGHILPVAIAFFVTIIPFHQGMNRHLDFHYIERTDPNVSFGLFLDFVFFMFEGGIFFAIASSVRLPAQATTFFGLLLFVDIIWALVAMLAHRTRDRPLSKWPGINFAALIVGVGILAFNFFSLEWKGWLLASLAVGRTVWDYTSSWSFYFPFKNLSDSTNTE